MAEIRKLAAILAADVVGFSRLAATDEERTLARLRALRSDLIDPTIAVHHGRVVKRTGDGVLIEFRSVVDAVRCAIEAQNGMAERNVGLPPERRIEFRIGIHLGDIVEESDGDLMGDGVNIAARLEGIAKPGAICLSEDAYRQVKSRLDLAVSDLGAIQLKNIPEPVRVYSLEVGRAPALVRSAGGHFMDKPDNVISLINLATVRSLEQQWGVAIDPLRFRANIYVDGAKPWEEFDWVGSEIRIGGTVFFVDRKNGRCGATNVNPGTGRRDLDIPSSLRATFGHKNLGIYLIVREGGQIAVGDLVFVPRSVPAAAPRAAFSVPLINHAQRQFICRGCYFIYEEANGLPQQSITPGTQFADIPATWRCPDCGTDKSTFRPYVEKAAAS